jgi:hypothetical protein
MAFHAVAAPVHPTPYRAKDRHCGAVLQDAALTDWIFCAAMFATASIGFAKLLALPNNISVP